MIASGDEDIEENPPRRRLPPTNRDSLVILEPDDDARVLAPLLKSLGWELVGVGAEFEIDNPEPRKPTGRMRNLFGRQVAAQPLVGSSPTASASYS